MKNIISSIILFSFILIQCVAHADSYVLDNAYQEIKNGNLVEAINIANTINDNKYGEVSLLKGWIYFKDERYQQAIDEVNSFLFKKESSETPEAVKIFYEMTLLVGVSSYKLGNCENTIDALVRYMKKKISEDNKLIPYASMVAVCYYNQKNYEKSLEYFKYISTNVDDVLGKNEAAYNVAALYSLIGNAAESVMWLHKIVDSAEIDWIEKSVNDSDFDAIRNNSEYRKLREKSK